MRFPTAKAIRAKALADAGHPIEVVLAGCLTELLLKHYRREHAQQRASNRTKKPKPQRTQPRQLSAPRLTQEERDRERLNRILNPPLRGLAQLHVIASSKKSNERVSSLHDDPFWFLPEELRAIAQAHWDRLLERHRDRLESNPRLIRLLKGNAVFLAKHPEMAWDKRYVHRRYYSKMRNLSWLRHYMARQNAALVNKAAGLRFTMDDVLQEHRAGMDPIGRRLDGI